jgi:hypothetical protein
MALEIAPDLSYPVGCDPPDFGIFHSASLKIVFDATRNGATRRYAMTLIEIRPHRWGWKVFEALGVEPVFLQKEQAIGYAETRACFRKGEIRVLDSSGNIERTIAFNETDRRLG